MKARWTAAVLLVGMLAVCGSAFAHHGNVAYMDKTIDLKNATVTEFLWVNPHSFVKFDVTNDKGEVEHWACEAGSPSALTPRGWTKNSIKPGDTIAITLFQAKNGNKVGRLAKILTSDGRELHDSQNRDTQTAPAAPAGGTGNSY
jgi:hypothetical protein